MRNKVRLSQSPVRLASGAGLGKNNLRLRDEFKKKTIKLVTSSKKVGGGLSQFHYF